MSSTDTAPVLDRADHRTGGTGLADRTERTSHPDGTGDSASVGAGLDALDAVTAQRGSLGEVLRGKALPPLIGVLVVLALWQGAYSLELTSSYKLPSPADVWRSAQDLWYQGTLLSIIWTSVWRGLSGFLLAV
ncbi:ABC transporter permease, partial [Kitasatospora sp. NPDC004799]